MTKQSAGILLYRKSHGEYEVLLVHPGGPFWAKKDQGSWSMPKGEFGDDEQPLAAAKREFAEEMGSPPPEGEYASLGEVKIPSGKIVHAFTLESDFNLETFKSNMFEMEWPPKSGQTQEFPEADKAAWLTISLAAQKITKGQTPLLERLAAKLGITFASSDDTTDASPAQASLF